MSILSWKKLARIGLFALTVLAGLPSNAQNQIADLEPWMETLQKTMPAMSADLFSNAKPDLAVTKTLVWSVEEIDFEKKEIKAIATYTYANKVRDNKEIVLDVSNLNIESITVNEIKLDESSYEIELSDLKGKPDALHIPIPAELEEGTISIQYQTNSNASGLFWIEKEFTEGKKHPLLYTLFQATEGASVIPGQHSPQVRITYVVNVKTGNPAFMALSSVSNNPTEPSPDGTYKDLTMDRAIPLYLLSLVVVGDMKFQAFDDRTGIYAEE